MEPHTTLHQRSWRVATLPSVITGQWELCSSSCLVESHPLEERQTKRSSTMFSKEPTVLTVQSGSKSPLKPKTWSLNSSTSRLTRDWLLKRLMLIHGSSSRKTKSLPMLRFLRRCSQTWQATWTLSNSRKQLLASLPQEFQKTRSLLSDKLSARWISMEMVSSLTMNLSPESARSQKSTSAKMSSSRLSKPLTPIRTV